MGVNGRFRIMLWVKSPHRLRSRLRVGLAATLSALGVVLAVGAAPAAATSRALGALGQPDQIGYAVADLNAVKAQLEAATGVQFGPVTTTPATVVLSSRPFVEKLALTRTRSVRGGPVLELVQASSPVGPWEAGRDHSSFFISYSVRDVVATTLSLTQAGLVPVAIAGTRFAFLRTSGGVLIRVIEELPTLRSGRDRAPGTTDLGPVDVATYFPCDPTALKRRLTTVVGPAWRPQQRFTLPYFFPDGSQQGFDVTVESTVADGPFVSIETPVHTPEQGPCTATRTPVHLVYFADDVAATAPQLVRAGMPVVSHVPGLVSDHQGIGGVFLTIASSAFIPAR